VIEEEIAQLYWRKDRERRGGEVDTATG